MTVGVLSAFVLYLQRIFVPIREFSGKLAIIQRASASLDRIWGLFAEEIEPQLDGDEASIDGWSGGVKIRDLRFRYREDTPEVLRGIDLDIAPGEVVAVVGRTGSGKSSLGRVLTQIYDGYEGSVSLECASGPVELRELVPAQLRRKLLMVQQDVFLFDDDARFNVTLGQDDLDGDDAILEGALDVVQAGFVRERGGLAMQVGERGRSLSAGEAQLLAFARVAARKPTMLILDEATASVDSMTEQRVQAAIEGLLKGRSVLVIAHRLSTIRHADKIVVMRDGQIAEIGNHDELMAAAGLYAELYESAFAAD
jgi:ATP-binding cassette subfamily B protein